MNFSGQIIADELILSHDQMDSLESFFESFDYNVEVWQSVSGTSIKFDNFEDSDEINSILSKWCEINKGDIA